MHLELNSKGQLRERILSGWRQTWSWRNRKDLLDYVIKRGADFTVWFIQNVGNAKPDVLAALFDKGEGEMIDDVLKRSQL